MVVSSEVVWVMRNVELVAGMETGLREELQERERVRHREAAISRKIELELGLMTKRLGGGRGEQPGQ